MIVVLIVAALVVSYGVGKAAAFSRLRSGSQVIELPMGPMEYALVGDSGPVVLFLHGSPGGYDHAAFRHPSHRTLAPSRPGSLRTPLSVGASPAEQADAFAALLDALELPDVVVMAASGGGPSALELAARHPSRVRCLILIEPVSHALELPPIPALMRSDLGVLLFAALVRPGVLARMLVHGEENQRLALRTPETRARLTGLVRSSWPPSRRLDGWSNDAEHARSFTPPTSLSVPCLVVHGTEDRNVPFEHSERLVAQLPGCILHAIEGGDHFMPITHSEELRDVVSTFMAAHA